MNSSSKENRLPELLAKAQHNFHSIMGEKLTKENCVVLDFSNKNRALCEIDLQDTNSFSQFVFNQINEAGAKYGVGGYLEDRIIYTRSEMFESEQESRSIHLGFDIWQEANTQVYAPLDGVVFLAQDNAGFADYGPTIILKHRLEDIEFFTLYGHLSDDSLNLKKGDQIKAGQAFCKIGNFPSNGDWPPHLHFQIINDTLDSSGDYPGVCAKKYLKKYAQKSPNPNLILSLNFQ